MRHGSKIDPPNRFESTRRELDLEQLEWDQEYRSSLHDRKIEYLDDQTQSIVSENKSPDIPFRFSANPYRGCIHACAYCYARPTHEYLGFNAGLDFETKILVKRDAPSRLRDFLAKPSWKPESIAFSGVTDCYQPAEREFRLTRACIEVALECRQPISVITKNALILRDLDLLTQLAKFDLVHTYISITTLDPELARAMEPRTSTPDARLRAVSMLANANVPVGVMTAPIIPGLNDSEIPNLLKAAKDAGAITADYILLRLPLAVEQVFIEWLRRTHPSAAQKVIGRIEEMRDGRRNSSRWGTRMTGTGPIADQIRSLFNVFRKKYGIDQPLPEYNFDNFRPPSPPSGQLNLF